MIVSLESARLGTAPRHGWGRMWRRLGVVSALALVVSLVVPAQPVWAETIQDQQWYLDTLHVEEAHQIARGEGITVAVVDTGVGECDDLDGQVMDIGYSPFIDGTGFDEDVVGHGTGMAGIIAATGVDEGHYLGIAPEATIMSVFVSAMTDLAGAGSTIAEGIRWAVDNGAQVVNLSLGSVTITDDEEEAVEYALSQGLIVVAGTGNLSDEYPDWTEVSALAAIPGVIAVTGTDQDGNLADFAIRGEGTILAAPAADIPLVQPDNLVLTTGETYSDPIGGTSNSTAIVSAAAALVWSAYPELTANDVIQRLITTADDRGPAGYDTEYGYGELNLLEALTADVPRVVANPLTRAGASANASAASAGVEPGSSGDGDGGDQTGDGGGSSALPILFGTLGVLAVAVAAGAFVLRRDRQARSRGW